MDNNKPLISFDYAIKYLLKDKGDYSIVEGFISALLNTQGYKDVKIVALLETESNKEDPKSKRSLADVIVQDSDNNKYIIEIERNVQDAFMHKACFNTSRLIVDNIAHSADYKEIVKVFHITLLYFPLGTGPIYHGKTIIHETESQEKLSFHIKDMITGKAYDTTEVFPEYFFISVPMFKDRLEKEIDDWLYVMKHDEVPVKFHSRYMEQVKTKLNILKMTPAERDSYYYYLKKVYTDRDELQAAESRGVAQGIEQGIAQGREQGIVQGREQGIVQGREQGIVQGTVKGIEQGEQLATNRIAKKLLQQGTAIQTINKLTGLTLAEIEALILSPNND